MPKATMPQVDGATIALAMSAFIADRVAFDVTLVSGVSVL